MSLSSANIKLHLRSVNKAVKKVYLIFFFLDKSGEIKLEIRRALQLLKWINLFVFNLGVKENNFVTYIETLSPHRNLLSIPTIQMFFYRNGNS